MVVYTLGSNFESQLSLSSNIRYTAVPTIIPFFTNKKISKIACGFFHTLVLIQHKVYSYGCSKFGKLGREGPQQDILEIKFNEKVFDISCGQNHSAVLTEDGKLYAWGQFYNPRLRILSKLEANVHEKPQMIAKNVKKIASCRNFLVILDNDNRVYIYYGLVISKVRENHFYTELNYIKEEFTTNLNYDPKFISIKTGPNHFFVLGGGEVFGFGFNKSLRIGNKHEETTEHLRSCNVSDVVDCNGAFNHSLFLKKDKNLYIVGYNRYLINSTDEDDEEICEDLVLIDKNVDFFFCSTFFNLLAKKKELYTWGRNEFGQLGHSETAVYGPKLVNFDFKTNIAGIYAGCYHTIIVTED